MKLRLILTAALLLASLVPPAAAQTTLQKSRDPLVQTFAGTQTPNATAAGTTQGTCAQISAQTTAFLTVGSGAGACLAKVLGVDQTVENKGANVLSVYPVSNAAIDGFGINAPVGIDVGGIAIFNCPTITQCYSR